MTTGPLRVSAARRRAALDALRRGTVPAGGLDLFAVGTGRFATSVDEDLAVCAGGGAVFKAVRGEYGSGKTFHARWVAERAKQAGMATAEIQVSETETPLHRLETVYRRLCETLTTATEPPSAFRSVIDGWFFTLESAAIQRQGTDDSSAVAAGVDELIGSRLADLATVAPGFATGLRGYHRAVLDGDVSTADALASWLGGQPHVAASARRVAGIRGDLDHFLALGFLQGLLKVLREVGHPGLLVVLDEVETLQRVRSDARTKALNALRQLIDDVDTGRFPGLYLMVTGTPAFYDGRQGVQLLPPLASRLATDFTTAPRFDNPRAVQVRLAGFTAERLVELGGRVCELYRGGSEHSGRIAAVVDDGYLRALADAVTGQLGGQVGVTPRLFLRKLVAEVLDRVDQFPDFDPRRDYKLTVSAHELTPAERQARATDPDEIDLRA